MNWLDFSEQLAVSLITIPILTSGFVYLAKSIIDRWFKTWEQAYDNKLKFLSNRDNVRFSNLHQKGLSIDCP